jgi:branched-chain amino acid transport system substrate-binding protein
MRGKGPDCDRDHKRREGSMAKDMIRPNRRAVLSSLAAASLVCAGRRVYAAPAPIRVGCTLALTGPLAQTALVHKLAAEIFIADINKRGGLLGRPVEYVLYDDQSRADQTRSLYEKLITVDNVDLIMAPYATAATLAAISVAQRYGKIIIYSSMAQVYLATYDRAFPSSHGGPHPEISNPKVILDAWASTPHPPQSIAIAASKFPSALFEAKGVRDLAQKRGIKVAFYLEYDFPSRDMNPIAARFKDANPDLVWLGCLGVEGNQLIEAMTKIDYKPPRSFYLFPASGPLAAAPGAEGATAFTNYEEHPPMDKFKGADVLIPAFHERAKAAGLPYTRVDLQAGTEFAAWQLLAAAAEATNSLDDGKMADWLKHHQVETVVGKLRFNEEFNCGDDLSKVKQVQKGKWQVVWPVAFRQPGTTFIAP